MMEGMKRKEEREPSSMHLGGGDLIGVQYGGVGGGLPSTLSGCGSPLWTSSSRHPS